MTLKTILLSILITIITGTADNAAGRSQSIAGTAEDFAIGKEDINDILNELDKTIDRREQFNKAKERVIANLKIDLKTENPERKFHTCHKLFEEYKVYQYDSAYFYARELERLAKSLRGGGILIFQPSPVRRCSAVSNQSDFSTRQ